MVCIAPKKQKTTSMKTAMSTSYDIDVMLVRHLYHLNYMVQAWAIEAQWFAEADLFEIHITHVLGPSIYILSRMY